MPGDEFEAVVRVVGELVREAGLRFAPRRLESLDEIKRLVRNVVVNESGWYCVCVAGRTVNLKFMFYAHLLLESGDHVFVPLKHPQRFRRDILRSRGRVIGAALSASDCGRYAATTFTVSRVYMLGPDWVSTEAKLITSPPCVAGGLATAKVAEGLACTVLCSAAALAHQGSPSGARFSVLLPSFMVDPFGIPCARRIKDLTIAREPACAYPAPELLRATASRTGFTILPLALLLR